MKWNKIAAGIIASAAVVTSSHGQSADALLQVLVKKGILSDQEAEDLRTDLARENKEVNKLQVPGKNTTAIQLYGDFRGRYETFMSDEDAFNERNRFRYRLRVGATATFRDSFEVGFRLTTSDPVGGFGGDPISGNSSFRDNGSKKFVYIDQAYGRWIVLNPANPHQSRNWSGNVTVGKMENPFVISDLLFDGDYTPEGAATQWAYTTDDASHTFGLNMGAFILDELQTSSRDPFLLGAQIRVDSVWSEVNVFPKLQSSVGLAVLSISRTDSLTTGNIPDVNRGNTRDATTAPAYNFNPIVADGSFTYTLEKFPFYAGNFPMSIAGEYVYNPGAPTRNQAFAAGVTVGKTGKKGSWQMSYRYRFQESDSWFEEFVESDFGAFYGVGPAGYFAGTNTKGHVFRIGYSPYDSITLNASYFLAEVIDNPSPGTESELGRLQVDAVWKF